MAHARHLRPLEALLDQFLADNTADDTLRRGLEAFLATLMEAEVSELAGAAHGERSEERVAYRNGYRDRKGSVRREDGSRHAASVAGV